MSDDALTNTLRPSTDSLITLRVIKSFQYRTEKNLVLSHLDLTKITIGELKELARKEILTRPGYKPFKSCVNDLDTLKLYTKAHGSKTQNLIINVDHPEWIYEDDNAALANLGIEHETEISFFNRELYEAFLQNPDQAW